MAKIPKRVVAEHTDLMEEWDYNKNNNLNIDPTVIGEGSNTKAWWKCKRGHSWRAMISNRTRHGRGCPYCAHQLPIKGETDFATLYPELLKEGHPTKNTCNPFELMPGTHKKVWWRCKKGHEWEAEIKSRVSGVGCPYCANKKILKGFNDLATVNPELAAEWHPDKNGDLTPYDVSPSSGKKVWWKCKNGHVFYTQVCNRSAGRGCPKCSDRLRTSFPEQAVYYYVKQIFPDAVNSYKDIFKSSMELDIYIPSIKVGIEYDGRVFHSSQSNKLRDARKYSICKSHGIKLIRIYEPTIYIPLFLCDHKIEIPDASDKYLNWAIYNLCAYLGKRVNPDVRKDRKQILEFLNIRKTSLASEFPMIAKEWDYEGNYPLVPENFPPHSNERVLWKCSVCGHSWNAAISDRTGDEKNGCPVCARKRGDAKRKIRRLHEQGSLADTHPWLLTEWDFDNNKDISPYEVIAGSPKKVFWVCKTCGYTWKTSIVHRTKRGSGCPCCSNQVIVAGVNDFATLCPELLNEWDYDKNNELGITPQSISKKSGKKVHWICSVCGHKWTASTGTRSSGHGCPNYRNHKTKYN